LSRARSIVRQVWPTLALLALIVAIWQLVYLSGQFNRVVLPSPVAVWNALRTNVANGKITDAVQKSLVRLGLGFGLAIIGGTLIGLGMAVSSLVQRSVGSLMVGLQSLPSISWLPLAILWFGLTRGAILFVVVLGALPSVALATAASVRQVPPILQRAGRTLGARRMRLWGRVIFPAAIPGYLAGLQQGWAFAWRSLMAGELIAGAASVGLGQLMEFNRQLFHTSVVMAVMIVIVAIGMVVDLAFFAVLDRRIRARRGLLSPR
jgi:NitT/TauT family transport system permease protein